MAKAFDVKVTATIMVGLFVCGASQAQQKLPDIYTPEQKEHFEKQWAEGQESLRNITDAEREKVNSALKAMHGLCAAKEKKLLYGVDHETVAREARLFAANLGWASRAPDGRMRFNGNASELPASIRDLTPNWVSVSADRVHIEFGGGMQHQGLTVFREANGGSGTVRVGEGIWYTSEDNRRFIGQPPPQVPPSQAK